MNPRTTKGQAYRASQLAAKYPSILNAIDKDQHRRKRKFIGLALTERSLRSFEPTMSMQVDIFLRQLLRSSEQREIVNLSPRCQRLGLDIIGLLSFGYHFNTQTEESHRFLQEVIDNMSWRINMYMAFPFIKPLESVFMLCGAPKLLKFHRLVTDMIKKRMSEGKDARHDLYSVLADHVGKNQEGLYKGELWPEAILFIMAGGSTTAAALSAAFFYLAHNPKVYDKLATEIRSTFKSGRDIHSGEDLRSCKYLRACIDETLRMSPAATVISWRQIDPKDTSGEPWIVDGHVIPPGTQVGVPFYSLFHNEEYFPDSFTWKPERWSDPPGNQSEEESAARAAMHNAFHPFQAGDRSCLGKPMAYLEASLTLARTLWYFDFETAPGVPGLVGAGTEGKTDGRGRPNEFQLYDIFVAGHDGPNLVFKPRAGVCKDLE
ncbi:cytochrome P450 [Apiospora arundinis]